MIKDLRDARLVDAVPRVVAGQDWVRCPASRILRAVVRWPRAIQITK